MKEKQIKKKEKEEEEEEEDEEEENEFEFEPRGRLSPQASWIRPRLPSEASGAIFKGAKTMIENRG